MGVVLGTLFSGIIASIGSGISAAGAAIASGLETAGLLTALATTNPVIVSAAAPPLIAGGSITAGGVAYSITTLGYIVFGALTAGAVIGIGYGIGSAFGGVGQSDYNPIPIEDRLNSECFNFNPFEDELSNRCRVLIKSKNDMSMEGGSEGYVGLQYDVQERLRSGVEQLFSRGQYRSNASGQVGQQRKRVR